MPFSIVPMSRRYTEVPAPGLIGVLSNSLRLPPNAALVRAIRSNGPVNMLPDGITSVALLTAAMASSGETLYCCNLSGFSVITIVR